MPTSESTLTSVPTASMSNQRTRESGSAPRPKVAEVADHGCGEGDRARLMRSARRRARAPSPPLPRGSSAGSSSQATRAGGARRRSLRRRRGRRPVRWPVEGCWKPESLRTNCTAEARISSSVAGGSKLKSVRMLRHIGASLRPRGASPLLAGGSDRPGRRGPTSAASALLVYQRKLIEARAAWIGLRTMSCATAAAAPDVPAGCRSSFRWK